MFEIFTFPFMQRALIAGVLVGFIGSYYGVFIVQRRMSFLGSGLAHAAFGGVALGLLLNTEPLWIALPFTIIVSAGILFIRDKTRLEADTSIGIFFAISMALGIIFLALKGNYATDAFTYLFGSILAVHTEDLIFAGLIALITVLTFIKLWSKWAYASFDRELAQSDRISVPRDDYLLSILIAVTIVVSVKIVGILLIAAFLVIPAASARIISGSFFKMTVVSIIFGVAGSLIGLWLSYILDLPTGATIIIFEACIFMMIALFGKVFK